MDRAARAELNRLVVRLADGDRDAFDPLYDRVLPLVRALARRLLSDDAAAEDATQQAMLAVFSRASEFDPTRDALPWLLAIVANECRTSRNRQLRRREEPEVDVSVEDVVDRDLVAALYAVVDDLGADDRATLRVLLELEDRPDIAPATFRKRVQRAIGRLRTAWRARHGAL